MRIRGGQPPAIVRYNPTPALSPMAPSLALRFGDELPEGLISNGIAPKVKFEVFISYHTTDQTEARMLAKLLAEMGHSAVMRSPDALNTPPLHLPWVMENTHHTVVLLSPESVSDPILQREQNQALGQGIQSETTCLFPLYIRDCEPGMFIQSLCPGYWSTSDKLKRMFTMFLSKVNPDRPPLGRRPPFPGNQPTAPETSALPGPGPQTEALAKLIRRYDL